jgi:drug/metabolite transporter, DME family
MNRLSPGTATTRARISEMGGRTDEDAGLTPPSGPAAATRGGLGGQWYVLAAAILWGTTGTAQAYAPPGAHSIAVGTVRLVIGGLILLLLAALQNGFKLEWRLPRRPLLFASVGVAAYQLCFFGGVSRTGVAVGTLVGIGSAPILAGLLGWLFRGEKPNRRWSIATFLAVAGCGLLVGAGSGDVAVDHLGITLAIGAGAMYAVYTLATKELLGRGHPPDTVVAIVFALGALLLVPSLFVADLGWLAKPAGLAVALHLGIVATAASYLLFARGLLSVPAATAVTLSLAEPLTAAALGVFILGESLVPVAVIGVGLLFTGLAVLSVRPGRLKASRGFD